MYIVWVTMLFVLMVTTFSVYYSNNKILYNYDGVAYKIKKPNKALYSIAIFSLVLISGLRSSIGDTGYYMYSYTLEKNFSELFSNRDWGFTLYQSMLQKFFSHPQFLLIISALITISLILITLYKYSPALTFSIFLFISSGTYISTMNGLRQYLIASIIFAAFSLILKNKKWKFIFLVLVLSLIHASVLIMIPVYFIVRQKAWSKKIIFLTFAIIFTFLGFETIFVNLFENLLERTQYDNYIDSLDSFKGTNTLRIIVSAIPVLLAFVFRKRLKASLPNYDIYVNFSLLNFLIMLFASYSWIFARISMYFDLYNLILLPAIIYYCFERRTMILVGYFTIVCYLIYFYFGTLQYIYASYYLNINKELIGPLTRMFYN